MKLRYFLFLVFLSLSLGPLLLFRAWPHSAVLQGELDEVHERHLLLARNLAAALERYHRDVVTTFDLFAASQTPWTDTASTKRMLENLSFRHLCLVDAESGRLIDALAPPVAPCPSVVPAETFARLKSMAEAETISFGPVVDAPDGEKVIHLVTRRGDRIVIGAITTSYFRELGEAISFGVMGHAAIVDHTGRALSHPLADWVDVRKDMSKISAVQRMLNRETGVETFYSPALDGDMIAGFTFVDPVGWGVMIPQPISELYQRADDARRSSLIVLLIGTLAALALAMIVSLRVVRPLERVSRASASIAEGRFSDSEPPNRTAFLPIELSELQTRFYEMVRRLRENMTTINALAYADMLTGLGNRTILQMRLDRAIAQQVDGALLLIDLDGFKAVNDIHGHDVGDAVLETVGARLREVIGLDDSVGSELDNFGTVDQIDGASVQVARMGGDEFAIWLPKIEAEKAEQLASDIIVRLREPILAGGVQVSVGASLGVAYCPEDAADRLNLVKAADLALYDAKRRGKNRYTVFAPALRKALDEERRLSEEIEVALAEGEFEPFFQPQFSLPDREFAGVEALVRWNHPSRGLLKPKSFLPMAREMGVLQNIDAIVFEQSIRLLSDLSISGTTVRSLAVNVSEESLRSPTFLRNHDHLSDLPFELRFELIETMVLDRIEGRLAWTLDRIRENGYKLDLDDFGSANASVLGLLNIEPAHLKIDQKLIIGMGKGSVAERLVQSIIEMGHSLDVNIIAEGVEDIAVIERLAEMKCDIVQGYALAQPMSIHQLGAFLRSYRPIRTGSETPVAS